MSPNEKVQEELQTPPASAVQRQVEVECEGAVIVIMPPTIPGLDGTVLRWDALLNPDLQLGDWLLLPRGHSGHRQDQQQHAHVS